MEFSTVEKKDDIVSSSLSLIYACMHMILTLNHKLLHCESSHSVIIHITPNISTVQIASVPPAFLSHVFVLVLQLRLHKQQMFFFFFFWSITNSHMSSFTDFSRQRSLYSHCFLPTVHVVVKSGYGNKYILQSNFQLFCSTFPH